MAGNIRPSEPDAPEEHVAIRQFHQHDQQTGQPKFYEGTGEEPYTGALDLPYLLDPAGPDGKGPLIAKKSAKKTAPPAASGDSSKEK